MARSKTRRRQRSGAASHRGEARPPALRTGRYIAIGVVAVAVIGAAGYWWRAAGERQSFDDLAATGRPALADVRTTADDGRTHLQSGESHRYRSPFATSGPHEPVWTEAGFHAAPQPPTRLVHALEHGNIVIYYDQPGDDVLATLKDWVGLYGGQWDGIVVTPAPDLGEAVVLTAWRKELRLERFDATTTAAFIDAFRGRGPENRVR